MLPSTSPEVYGPALARESDDEAEDEVALGPSEADAPLARRFSVEATEAGERLDKLLATRMPEVSRSRLKQWIEDGAVRVNGGTVRPRHAVLAGDLVELEPQPAPDAAAFVAEALPLDVVHEDDAIIVVDKPPALVVHPAAGHWSGTLLNRLLFYAPELAQLPRAGIVHRLDAGTSGLMVVARTLHAHTELVRQLQARSVHRAYWAIVLGEPRRSGTVDAPIGRDPRNPLRFRVSHAASARAARTHYTRVATMQQDGAAPLVAGTSARDRAHPPDPRALRIPRSSAGRRSGVPAPAAGARSQRAVARVSAPGVCTPACWACSTRSAANR